MHFHTIFPVGLMNIGTGALKYTLNIEKFNKDYSKLAKSEVLKFDNSVNSIQGGKKKNFTILFKPTQAKPILCTVSIDVSDFFRIMQTIELTIIANPVSAFDKNVFNSFFNADAFAHNQELCRDNSNSCYFSDDYLDFRDAKLFSKIDRLILLYNSSKFESLEFNTKDFELSK